MQTSMTAMLATLACACAVGACKGEPKTAATAAPRESPAAGAMAAPAPTRSEPAPAEAPAPSGDEPAPSGDEPAPSGDEPAPVGEAREQAQAEAVLDYPLVFAPDERMPASDCEALIAKEAELIRETGTDELKEALAKASSTDLLAKCRAAPYPKVVADCARQATNALDLYRGCYTLPFRGRDLIVGREFKAGDPANADAAPKMFTQHGDLIVISEGCGLLFQRAEGFVGAFLVCDGQTQGPFTTNGDIKAVFDALSAESSARHKMMMGIIANYPSGGTGRYRVCNSAGVCTIE